MLLQVRCSFGAEHYYLAYFAMRAYILLGQSDGAAEELHNLATHKAAPQGLCLKAMEVQSELSSCIVCLFLEILNVGPACLGR